MPNLLDANGLQVASTTEIVASLTASFQAIYGSQINVSANSPDGQLINILAQNIEDVLQLLVQVYNSFAVDSAFGIILDQRVALSGIIRNQGTFTEAFVSVTATTAITLPGQDVLVLNPGASVFTVADTAGNQYQLGTSYTFGGAGTTSLAFFAVTLGQIQTVPNTITTIVTVTPGISGVNNPTTANDVEGLPEETDPQLKIRQANSYFLQAVAPADSIRAALLNIPTADAFVAENDTNSPNQGVPAHGLWIIVNPGGATPSQIGTTIYRKKNPGCALVGAQSYAVVRPQGNTAVMQWDNALTETLYVQATLFPRIPGQSFDVTADGIALANALVYKLGQQPNVGDIVNAMTIIEPLAIVTSAQVSSDGVVFEQILSPSDFQHYFVAAASRVTLINA